MSFSYLLSLVSNTKIIKKFTINHKILKKYKFFEDLLFHVRNAIFAYYI